MRIIKWLLITVVLVCVGIPALFATALVVNYHREIPPTKVPIAGTPAVLVLHRQPAHFFLAEYHRQLSVVIDGHEIKRTEIWVDSGGEHTMDVYRTGPRSVAVADRINSYVIDLSSGTLAREKLPPQGAEFLGTIDNIGSGADRRYRFIPRSEKPEPSVKPARSSPETRI